MAHVSEDEHVGLNCHDSSLELPSIPTRSRAGSTTYDKRISLSTGDMRLIIHAYNVERVHMCKGRDILMYRQWFHFVWECGNVKKS
jgi:hypothetical protein